MRVGVPLGATSVPEHGRETDDVGVEVTATDVDTSECVVVDLHGLKAVNLGGVMVDPGQEHLTQFSSSERS